jgi:hypothetical protein
MQAFEHEKKSKTRLHAETRKDRVPEWYQVLLTPRGYSVKYHPRTSRNRVNRLGKRCTLSYPLPDFCNITPLLILVLSTLANLIPDPNLTWYHLLLLLHHPLTTHISEQLHCFRSFSRFYIRTSAIIVLPRLFFPFTFTIRRVYSVQVSFSLSLDLSGRIRDLCIRLVPAAWHALRSPS